MPNNEKKGFLEKLGDAAGLSEDARTQRKITRLLEIVAEEPKNVEAWEQLALSYEMIGNTGELRLCYRKLGNLYRAQREPEIALGYYDRAEGLWPKRNIGLMKEKLAIYFECQRLEDAYGTARMIIDAHIQAGEREAAINFLRLLPNFGANNSKWRRELTDLIPGKEGKTELLRTSWRSLPRFNPENSAAGQTNAPKIAIAPPAKEEKPGELIVVEPKLELNDLFSASFFLPKLTEEEDAPVQQQVLTPPASDMARYSILIVGKDTQWRAQVAEPLRAMGAYVVDVETIQQAWESCAHGLPSLVLAQQTNNDWDWCQLFAQLQGNCETNDIPFICLSHYGGPEATVQALSLGVTDCWNWPQSGDEFIARVRHVLNLSYDERNALVGTLAEISLPDLLQMLEGCRKSGVLVLKSERQHGVVIFQDGRAIDAQYSRWQGELAFFRLIQWTAGLFRFQPQPIDRPARIHDSVQGLLMDSMRRMDEQAKIIETLPAAESVLIFNPALSATMPISNSLPKLMALFNGQHTLGQCLAELDMDVDTIELVSNFISRNVLINAQ